jgi:hypothetical protein
MLIPASLGYADGSEVLGNTPVAPGSHIAAGGTGLFIQPGTISVTVPAGAVINQVLVYWEGQSTAPGDNIALVGGIPVVGSLIGGPTVFYSAVEVSSYRADITGLGLVSAGAVNLVDVEGLSFTIGNDGAGILVIYDDGTRNSRIEMRDGLDLAFWRAAPPLLDTVAQTFTFPAASAERIADLSMFFGSVAGPDRPNLVEIDVDGDVDVLVDPLGSYDGGEWDTLITSVAIPAGATTLTVHPMSAGGVAGQSPASLAWVNIAMALPCAGAIGDFVWDDLNADGIQDDGEPGIAGVIVTLFDDQNVELASTSTDGAGAYLFSGLCAGTYQVVVDESSLPAGHVASPTTVGGDPSVDSNPNPETVVLADDVTEDLTVDFGYSAAEDCNDCSGKVTELTLRYLGEVENNEITVQMKGKRRAPGTVVFDGIVPPGETFAFFGDDKHGTLGTEILITQVNGTETRIHTSCSVPIGVGSIFGDFEVVAGASKDGGPLCDAEPGGGEEPPSDCEGKVTDLTLLYIGSADDANIAVAVKARRRYPLPNVFEGIVQPGETFSFSGNDKKGTLGTEITITVNDGVGLNIHTSCSQPIGVGMVFGDFVVVAGASRNGGAFPPAP